MQRRTREEDTKARPQYLSCFCSKPKVTGLIPEGCPGRGNINHTDDEYEVIRLLEYIKLTQEQCAEKMNSSRPTVTRIYNEACQNIGEVLVNGKRLTNS